MTHDSFYRFLPGDFPSPSPSPTIYPPQPGHRRPCRGFAGRDEVGGTGATRSLPPVPRWVRMGDLVGGGGQELALLGWIGLIVPVLFKCRIWDCCKVRRDVSFCNLGVLSESGRIRIPGSSSCPCNRCECLMRVGGSPASCCHHLKRVCHLPRQGGFYIG